MMQPCLRLVACCASTTCARWWSPTTTARTAVHHAHDRRAPSLLPTPWRRAARTKCRCRRPYRVAGQKVADMTETDVLTRKGFSRRPSKTMSSALREAVVLDDNDAIGIIVTPPTGRASPSQGGAQNHNETRQAANGTRRPTWWRSSTITALPTSGRSTPSSSSTCLRGIDRHHRHPEFRRHGAEIPASIVSVRCCPPS